MIIAVVALFQKTESGTVIKNRLLSHFCYDAESEDDAKRDMMVGDVFLRYFDDGYSLTYLHAHAADMNAIVSSCSEAAKAAIENILEAAKKDDQKGEGEE